MCLCLFKEKWDVAIILDACRYNEFKKIVKKFKKICKTYELKPVIGASTTVEWLVRVFKKTYEDIIYISANPFIGKRASIPIFSLHLSQKFFKIIEAWREWDERLNTCLPSTVNKISKRVLKKYKNKRVIIHYIQPHAPYRKAYFLSEKIKEKLPHPLAFAARKIISTILYKIRYLDFGYFKFKKFILRLLGIKRTEHFLEDAYLRLFTIKELRQLYRDNLNWVCEHVIELLLFIKRNCPEKKIVVITSDHGEAFGEYNEYFHGPITTNKYVRIVPFLKIDL